MVREGAADPQQELRVVTLYPSRLMGHLGVQQLLSQTVQPLVEPDLRACSLTVQQWVAPVLRDSLPNPGSLLCWTEWII